MGHDNYKKSTLLKDFDITASLVRDYLLENYSQDLAETLIKDARQKYEQIIPEVPFIKGMRACALNSFLLITAQEIAAYKAMRKQRPGRVHLNIHLRAGPNTHKLPVSSIRLKCTKT